MNSYIENPTIGLHVLYILNMQLIFIPIGFYLPILSINLSFMYYFELQKPKFKQLIDNMAIDI